MSRSVDPVLNTGVLMRNHEANLTVRVNVGLCVVEAGLTCGPIHCTKPNITQLQLPITCVRDFEFDDHRFVGIEGPPIISVDDIACSADERFRRHETSLFMVAAQLIDPLSPELRGLQGPSTGFVEEFRHSGRS